MTQSSFLTCLSCGSRTWAWCPALKHFLYVEGMVSKRVERLTQAIYAGATVPDTNDLQLRLVSLTHPGSR